MSSISLDSLISEFPEESESVKRLVGYLESCLSSGPSLREVSAKRLFDHAQPRTQRVLAKILFRLTEQGVIRKIFRVESDALGGIGDYDSLESIPSIIHDFRLNREIEVRLDQIQIFYIIQQNWTSH